MTDVQPVRIKLYGVLTMTRGRYLAQLGAALALAAVALGLWWWRWAEFRDRLAVADDPALGRFVAVMNALPWIVLAAVALQLLEAFFVLRRFRREEARQTQPGG
ncbi:MAG: hypothetical protein U0797_15625 [Gemmataceae bacterium]